MDILLRRIALVAYATIVAWLLFQPGGVDVEVGNDKLGHIALFAGWAIIFWLNWPHPVAILGVGIAVAAGTELVQGQIPGRTPEWLDFIANLVGLLAGLVVIEVAESPG